jgi:2,3-bisphosphoglycerate-independent phosphoglycerate mutase
MVGHTGVPVSIRIAVETVDLCLGRLLRAVRDSRGVAMVSADHGNADCMWTEKNGQRTPMVSHTKNPVPFIIKDYTGVNRFSLKQVDNPGLSNVAATICNLLGYRAPEEYDSSLIALSQ